MTCPLSGLSNRDIDYTYIRRRIPNLSVVILLMDETSLLLPARSCSSASPSPSGSAQPDRRLLADESGPSSSRVLESEAPPRHSGLREIAHLFRDSIPGAHPSSSSLRHFRSSTLLLLLTHSDLLVHPPTLPPDRIGHRRRASWFDGAVCVCLLSDVGICDW